jgi:hypothetical protein
MILEMHGKGIPVELIVGAVAKLEEAMAARAVSTGRDICPVDTSMMEKRRAWDRERKRKQRSLKLPDSRWWTVIGQVLHRDGHRCTYCESTQQLTADHVVPLTRGGTNDLSNLTACCIPCNTQKGNKLLSEWSGGQSARFHPTVRRNPPDNACISKKEDVLSIEVEEKKESKIERKNTRGTRCPPDFALDGDDRAFAAALGLPPEIVEAETPQFIDYWSSVPGAKGVKLDWKATWRNRMRDLKKYQPATRVGQARPLTEFQRGRNETKDILNDLDNFASGRGGGSQENTRLLPGNSSERSSGIRGGAGGDIISLPTAGHRSRP